MFGIAALLGFAPVAEAICQSQLAPALQREFDRPALRRSRLGVAAVALRHPTRFLADVDGDRYFIPASVAKLFVTAAALDRLGRDRRFPTRLVTAGSLEADGTLRGDLWAIGGGDPGLTSDKQLQDLAAQVAGQGIRRIAGDVAAYSPFADLSFPASGLATTWEWGDLQEDFGAIAAGLTLDENVLLWTIRPGKAGHPVRFAWDAPLRAIGWQVENHATTGAKDGPNTLQVRRSLGQRRLLLEGVMPAQTAPEPGATAIPDPADYFLRMLRQALARHGVQVTGNVRVQALSPEPTLMAAWREVARVDSAPAGELVAAANRTSHNLYAELLLRHLGQEIAKSSPTARDRGALGLEAVAQFLAGLGIDREAVLLVDGSGLSRQNLATPKAIVQVLAAMRPVPGWYESLAIAATSGTLQGRFRDTPLAHALRGKTGTLTGVVSLAGYLRSPDYGEIGFAIVVNHSNAPAKEVRAVVDAIALLLAQLRRC